LFVLLVIVLSGSFIYGFW